MANPFIDDDDPFADLIPSQENDDPFADLIPERPTTKMSKDIQGNPVETYVLPGDPGAEPDLSIPPQMQGPTEEEARKMATANRNREFSESLRGQVEAVANFDPVRDTPLRHVVPEWLSRPAAGVIPGVQEQQPGGSMGTDIVAGGIGGLYNFPSNVAETGMAVRDSLTGQNTAEEFREAAPRYVPDSTSGSIATGLTEMGAGAGAAGALTKAALANVTAKGMQGLGMLLGTTAGGMSAASPGTEGLVLGEKSLTGVSPADKLGIDNEILKEKIDLVADGLLTAGAMNGAANVATGGYNLFKDLIGSRFIKHFSTAAQQDEAVAKVLSELANVTPDMPEEEIFKRMQAVVDKVGENKNLQQKIFGKLTDEEMKQLTPEQIKILDSMRDTVTSLGDDAGARAKQLRAGATKIRNADTTPLTERLSEPARVSDDFLGTSVEQRGGAGGIKAAGEAVQEGAEKQAQAIEQKVFDKAADIDNVKADLTDVVQSDPTLGKKITDLADVDIDVYRQSREGKEAVRKELNSIKAAQDAKLGELSDAIPSDIDLDWKGIDDLIKSGDEATLKKYLGSKLTTLKEAELGGDLVKLTPDLSKAVDAARRQEDWGTAEILIGLRDKINDPIGGSPELEAYRNYYKNTWAKNWRDGALEDFSDNYSKTTARGIRPVDEVVEGKKVVGKALSDPDYVQQLRDAGVNDETISNALLGDALTTAQKQVNKGGKLTYDDLDGVINTLSNTEGLAQFPDLQKRIGAFATKVRDRKIEIGKLDEEFNRLVKDADKAKDEIFSKKFAEFFQERGIGAKRAAGSTNLDLSFDKLFSDPNNASKLDEVLNVIKNSDDPIVNQAGLEAAYLKSLHRASTGTTTDILGNAQAKTGFLKDEEAKRQFLNYGEKIFADKPATFKVAKELIGENIDMANARRAMGDAPESPEIKKGVRGAMDMIITMVAGPLSRTGARARSLGSKIIDKSDPDSQVNRFIVEILADPDKFEDLAQRFINKQKPSAKDTRDLIRWTIESGLRSPEERQSLEALYGREKDDVNEQTDKALSGQ